MLKKILIVCFLIIGAVTVHAQTLKITDVDASDPKLWNTRTKALLGKSFTLTFYDKTVKINLAGQETLILRKNGQNYYSSEDTGSETTSWELETDATLNVITSGTLTMKISEDKSPYRWAKLTLTGKRF